MENEQKCNFSSAEQCRNLNFPPKVSSTEKRKFCLLFTFAPNVSSSSAEVDDPCLVINKKSQKILKCRRNNVTTARLDANNSIKALKESDS